MESRERKGFKGLLAQENLLSMYLQMVLSGICCHCYYLVLILVGILLFAGYIYLWFLSPVWLWSVWASATCSFITWLDGSVIISAL